MERQIIIREVVRVMQTKEVAIKKKKTLRGVPREPLAAAAQQVDCLRLQYHWLGGGNEGGKRPENARGRRGHYTRMETLSGETSGGGAER